MRFLISIIFLFLCQFLFGQQLLFENYTSEDGLSQNAGYAISQDNNGFMWFGTQDGLNRYDGRSFKVYSQQNTIGHKLPSNIISSLFFDERKKMLWVGTIQGACLYDPTGDSLLKVSEFFPLASKLDNLPIKRIVSFKENEYWFLTFNHGLVWLDTKQGKLATFFNSKEEKGNITSMVLHKNKLYVSLLYSMFEMVASNDGYNVQPFHKEYSFPQIRELFSFNNDLWIGTMAEGCLLIHDPVEKRENIISLPIAFGGIGGFTVDRKNCLWIGSRGNGIYKFDPQTKNTIQIKNDPFNASTPVSNYNYSMFTDRQGNIWCGFVEGISKHDPLRFRFNNIDKQNSLNGSLSDKSIVRMYTTKDQSTFVGTLNKGILEWNRSNNSFTSYPGSEIYGTANNVIYDITEDAAGNLWTASCGGLMYVNRKAHSIKYYPETNLPELNKLYSLIKLQKADSLFIASENGFRLFSLKEKKWRSLPADNKLTTFIGGLYVFTGRYLYEDATNTVWICSVGSGLIKYRYLQNEVDTVAPVNKYSRYIRHLLPDGDKFWLATDHGLLIYDWKNDKILKHVLLNENGASNVCYAIEKDAAGYYWVSSNLGLYKLTADYKILQTYNTGNGLSFLEYNTACVLKDLNGDLHFGGMGGITTFNPARMQQNEYSPPPVITSIAVNDQPLQLQMNPDLIDDLDLSYKENFITLQFAVTNFSNEANNTFSYRLKGLTDNWSKPEKNNIASYTSLPPGEYSFELRSANSDGKWSDQIKSIKISILPAWWQTWWFWLLAAIALASIIAFAVVRRIKAIRYEASLKQQMAELEIKGLHAQMNPHFIFNSLNSIKEMILEDQKQNASRYLSKFAQLIRTSLEQSRQTFITIKQCADHLQQYLEMEKLRFEDFSYSIEIDNELSAEETQIAPMLVQPLVENAIWHGLRNKQNDRKLFIRFRKENNRVICEVEDNGVGLHQSVKSKSSTLQPHRSLGITNIRERLTLLNEKYNMSCSLNILDKADVTGRNGNGTLAILHLSVQA